MSWDVWVLTALVFPMPIVFIVLAFMYRLVFAAPALVVTAIWLAIWLYFRPSRFTIAGTELRLSWPLRSRRIALREIEDVALLDRAEFRRRYRFGMRVGAGGLWGGFGLLYTAKGMLSMYISRTDHMVLIQASSTRPLLITPADAERFVAELNRKRALP